MVIDMVMNERPLKRRKRVTVDYNYYDFLTFPAAGDFSSGGIPFRSAVQSFLSAHARPTLPNTLFPRLMTWDIQFRVGNGNSPVVAGEGEDDVVTLYVVEEDVARSSRSVYCDQCRVVGLEIILPALPSFFSMDHKLGCMCCNYEISEDDLERWLYHQLEDNTHVLHGVVHSNGYGHLLTLNGREGGSNVLCGLDIMNFWDRLCQTLSVRKITVMDMSKKYGIDYRLVHTIANGHPWYGNWGYEFGSASYGLTLDSYKEAITTLSNLSLSLFSHNPRRPRTHLQNVISFYQSISDSKLETLRDLFSFMLSFIQKTHKSYNPGRCENSKFGISSVSCNWSAKDIESVQQALIKVLQVACNANWVSKRALKGSLGKTAPPDLLELCLKNLGGMVAANGMVVNTRCNHNTMAIEFRLERFDSMYSRTFSNQPSKEDVVNDLKFLYDSILNPHTMVSYKPQATRDTAISSATKILDCKQLVKNYKPENVEAMNSFTIRILCHVELADHHKDDLAPPPELMVLPENVTVGDLKLEATKAFREVYVMFKSFEADKMLDYGPLDDSITLKLLVGLRGLVRVKGRCLGAHGLGRFRMERGTDNWIVDCMCGARDDDGERMLACDECGTWQHTRCAGIDNHEVVPAEFVCMRCLNSSSEEDDNSTALANKDIPASKTCRNASVTNVRRNRVCFTMSVH
ncbi:hypothetical protein LguiA_018598 [Lonicera macranthoides]